MLEALYNYFYSLFNGISVNGGDDFFTDIYVGIGSDNYAIPLGEYFSVLCALISFVIIFVLCCLFVYKIIKLVGGLITR